jgi:hypothetical protein
MFKLIGNKCAKIEINSSIVVVSILLWFLVLESEGMKAGMSEGPAFGGLQHCHGRIRHMLVKCA